LLLPVVALVAALGGTAHARPPTSVADQFGTEVIASKRSTTGSPTSIVGFMYLSDAILSAVSNGHGPLEIDAANGEDRAGDGRPITLNGATYLKGLGTHAPSRVRYMLPAGCTRVFTAWVGVDDEVGSRGSVVFRVFADASKVYDSGVMTGASATQHVDVSITGTAQLQLVVAKGGSDKDYDHADWANARIECGLSTQSRVGRDLSNLSSYPDTLSLVGLVVIASAFGIVGVALRRRERLQRGQDEAA